MIIVDDMSDIFCNFIQIDEHYECSKCGTKVSFIDQKGPPLFPCRSPLNGDPSNVPSAINRMIPNSSLDLIEQRYSICSSCEFLQNSTCIKCGCNITRDRNYMSKLSDKDASCPINKW